jgi:purine-cytosine permease-like protein
LTGIQIFIIRAVLGAVFAVILSRMFYPEADFVYVIGLGIILVGLAYVAEYFRVKRTKNR